MDKDDSSVSSLDWGDSSDDCTPEPSTKASNPTETRDGQGPALPQRHISFSAKPGILRASEWSGGQAASSSGSQPSRYPLTARDTQGRPRAPSAPAVGGDNTPRTVNLTALSITVNLRSGQNPSLAWDSDERRWRGGPPGREVWPAKCLKACLGSLSIEASCGHGVSNVVLENGEGTILDSKGCHTHVKLDQQQQGKLLETTRVVVDIS